MKMRKYVLIEIVIAERKEFKKLIKEIIRWMEKKDVSRF